MSGDLAFKLDASQIARLGNRFAEIEHAFPKAIGRALNHTGAKARTAMVRTLTKQTGLKRQVIVRALKVRQASYTAGAGASFAIESSGGDVALKFFSPKETRGGVTANVAGRRITVSGAFMKGGKWGRRVPLNIGGHVFKRAGAARLPIHIEKSHVYIPKEMVTGATAAAFYSVVESDLPARLEHELEFLMKTGGF